MGSLRGDFRLIDVGLALMPHSPVIQDARCDARSARGATWLARLADRLRRPVASSAYNAEIDGLRFIAIAIVVIGHFMERAFRFFPTAQERLAATPFGEMVQRPGMGVYLFFAISGFVLTGQAMKAKTSPLSAPFLKTYFGRRVLRIEPPYLILLVVTWLLISVTGYAPDRTHHFDAVPHSLGVSLLGSIFYLHDLLWGTYPRLFPPGWSLEIEVQFYLLAPLLFWAFLRAGTLRARVLLGVIGLAGGALLSIMAPQQMAGLHTKASLLQFFYFFWLGILIAYLHAWIMDKAEGLPPLVSGSLGWFGLAFYLALPNAPDDNVAVAIAFRACTLAALLAMFISAFAPASSFRAFCRRPWIAVIGGACYSIYLTHLQVIQLSTTILAKLAPNAGLGLVTVFLIIETAVVVAIGLGFYALIERTFMQKDWPQRFKASLGRWVSRPDSDDWRRAELQVVAGRSSPSRDPR